MVELSQQELCDRAFEALPEVSKKFSSKGEFYAETPRYRLTLSGADANECGDLQRSIVGFPKDAGQAAFFVRLGIYADLHKPAPEQYWPEKIAEGLVKAAMMLEEVGLRDDGAYLRQKAKEVLPHANF